MHVSCIPMQLSWVTCSFSHSPGVSEGQNHRWANTMLTQIMCHAQANTGYVQIAPYYVKCTGTTLHFENKYNSQTDYIPRLYLFITKTVKWGVKLFLTL